MKVKNELVSISIPIVVDEIDEKGQVRYRYINNKYFDAEIKKILSTSIKIMGMTKKKDRVKFNIETLVDSQRSILTFSYQRAGQQLTLEEVDSGLLITASNVVQSVISAVNSINEQHIAGTTLTPTYNPLIKEEFEVNSSEGVIYYKNRRSLSLVNDILILLPKLPEGFEFGSNSQNVPLKEKNHFAPPIRANKSYEKNIVIKGILAAWQIRPTRKIRLEVEAIHGYTMLNYDITMSCRNFNKLRITDENAIIEIELQKSTTTEQYNVLNFTLCPTQVDEELQALGDLF